MSGTADGPGAILEVSDQMEHFDEETLQEYVQAGVTTYPPIPAAETPELQVRRIYETVKRLDLFTENRFPIFLGGEHSVTAPIVRVAEECYENLSVLQFDAHADLRNEFTGGIHSHASVMRRVLEITPYLVQVGIRSFCADQYRQCQDQIQKAITPQMIRQDFRFALDKILYGLQKNVYITFDMDAFDPSEAPGVGTPEPGGLSWCQVIEILRKVFQEKNVIGADVVETRPLGFRSSGERHDHPKRHQDCWLSGHHENRNVVTEFLAARLVGKMMAYDFSVHQNK